MLNILKIDINVELFCDYVIYGRPLLKIGINVEHKSILCLQSPGGVRSLSTATLKQNRLNLTLFIDLCHSNLFHIILLFFVIY